MLFNSWAFAIFFVVVFPVYYFLAPGILRRRWMLFTSLFFYGSWKWEYLGLIFASSLIDWICAICIEDKPKQKKVFLWISLVLNLGLLGFFKYYNFFISNLPFSLPYANIIMPVGLSFYTFQTLGYSIDVYRGEIKAERNFWDFLLFISFFPQLVAGPIEKASTLLPQFKRAARLKDIPLAEVTHLITMGFFKKLVIADRLAIYVDNVYSNLAAATSWQVLLVTHLFVIQMYCDFSGYSDIARGLAKCFGFDLTVNFLRPFLAVNVKELLRRWHVTLVEWIKNYVYIPLGGNKHGEILMWRNYLIVMILSGLWHGANWTFVIWGIILALTLAFLSFTPEFRLPRGLKIAITFSYFCVIGSIFFRAQSMRDSLLLVKKLFSGYVFEPSQFFKLFAPFTRDHHSLAEGSATIILMAFWLWMEHLEEKQRLTARWLVAIFCVTLFFGKYDGKAFVYFNF
jgi:alginate O-acetyltransferase complex protein AlgI